jgi:nitrogen fixation protein NifB
MNKLEQQHPCFSKKAHLKYGRIHLPVAPKCNIQCRYCIRKYDCINESRPGVTSKVLTPEEAIYRLEAIIKRDERIRVVGVAGPGDSLANEETFVVLNYVSKKIPEAILCLSTNGVNLPVEIERLNKIGLKHISITINSVSIDTANKIYKWVLFENKLYEGIFASELIVKMQWLGLNKAIEYDMNVKVNTVYIPGINDHEIQKISYLCGKKGVRSMNIIPLIPQAEFSKIEPPNREKLNSIRALCAKNISQMTHCGQCRSDACGKLNENRDMELESFNYAIGEDYCEMII